MRSMPRLLFLPGLIIAAACSPTHGSGPRSHLSLRGVWQDDSVYASGWSNVFQFYDDGRYIFNHNTMDCAKRELSYSGRWSINKNNLVLSIEKRRRLVGGHLEPAMESCASDSEVVGGRETIVSDTTSQPTAL